jgi:hypothetical protein
LINRLQHEPSALLRDMASAVPEERAAAEQLLVRLFRLSDEGDEGNRR